MQKTTTFLWFDRNAEEAMNFYVDVFDGAPNKTGTSKVIRIDRYEKGIDAPGAAENLVECQDQKEVDYFWEKLSAVPESEQCGWVKDKFGLSWQITPKRLDELASDPDREKAHRVISAMLQMKKIDIAELERAYKG